MSVHAPWRAPFGRVGLVGRSRGRLGRVIARALPSSAPAPGGRRSFVVGLSMTSMIDVLVVLTVFLLVTFQAPGECGCITRDLTKLPIAWNGYDMLDAPLIQVTATGGMTLDGVVVATREEIASSRGRVARLDPLFNHLRGKRELKKQLAPGREVLREVVLAIDGDVPAALVKSVVMTATASGYSSINFMVQAAERPTG
jgi:biopolymer transport protein ExbD